MTNAIEGAVEGVRGSTVFGSLPAGSLTRAVRLEVLVTGGGAFSPPVHLSPAGDRVQFEIELPDALRDGNIRFIDVRVAGDATPLSGGPLIFYGGLFEGRGDGASPENASADEAQGRVEFDGQGRVSGWAWIPGNPASVPLEIWSNHRLVATVQADQPSTAAGPEGRHGFSFDLAQWLRGGPHELEICVQGARAPLPGGRIKVARLAKDGALSGDGYLDDPKSAELLAALPLEQFAYAGARMSPARLVPRLINRLKRERAGTDEMRGAASLILLGAQDADAPSAQLWRRQSYRRIGIATAPRTSAELRQAGAAAAFVFFAKPRDMLHPSAAASVMADRDRDCDVVVWHRFCGREARAGAPGDLWRRPPFDPATWRHGAVTDTTIAIKGSVLATCPDEVAAALLSGRCHPLYFWLAGQNLKWRTHPEALTVQVGDFNIPDRQEIVADWDLYENLLLDEGEVFSLAPTPADHPFPFILIPARRAAKTSVLICYRDRAEITLRTIHSLSRQHLTGELELVLVDNQSSPEESRRIVEGAATILGRERVVALTYDAPFNHSAQNNLAAEAASGEVIVICNNDVVLTDPFCIEQLSAWALQPGTGAVGCRLEDPDHARASFGHAFRPFGDDPFLAPLQEAADPSFGLFVHSSPGVTLALGAMSRDRFLELGGLDEANFPIGHNDTEFMLRGAEAGLTHLYLGHVSGLHARGSSRTGDDEDRQTLRLNQRYGGVLARRFVQLGREVVEGRVSPPPTGVSRKAAAKPVRPALTPRREPEAPEPKLTAIISTQRGLEDARLQAVRAGGAEATLLELTRAPRGRA